MIVRTVVILGLAAVLLTGCGSTRGERTATGALIGAGAGAAAASASGGHNSPLSGAIVGGALGAVVGGLSE
jgi:hypothetical protein